MIRLLIFACPKPFVEPFTIIQQNAINSWKQLHGKYVETEIYLLGDEIDVEQHATQLNVKHIPDIKKNQYGTPLVDDIFKTIKKIGIESQEQNPDETVVCCYINADIIVFPEFVKNIVSFIRAREKQTFRDKCKHADPNRYLLIGARWDTDNVPEIDFEDNEWGGFLTDHAEKHGQAHGCWGIDYFIFSPTTFGYIYPFALGKFVWDRWLVGNVFRNDSITVDITKTNFIVHQNSDWYQACTGGVTSNRKALFDTEEVKINQSFDYYEKDIISGTQFETVADEIGEIQFLYKENIPRQD